MPLDNELGSCVKAIALAEDLEKRVALATVVIRDIEIRGITVWRAKNGKLSVFFPSYKRGSFWDDTISVPDELRTEIEADVIAAYKNAKAVPEKDHGKHSNEDAAVKLGRVPRVQFPFEKL